MFSKKEVYVNIFLTENNYTSQGLIANFQYIKLALINFISRLIFCFPYPIKKGPSFKPGVGIFPIND